MNDDIDKLIQIIKQAAKQTLLPRFGHVDRDVKLDGSFVTEADLTCQQLIKSQLETLYPDYLFLAEEMGPEQQAALINADEPIWCLDPLDGTSNFAAGIPYFSISLCLIKNGKVQLAIVYDPCRDECFHAQRNQGAFLNNLPLHIQDPGLKLNRCTALVDFKRLSTEIKHKLIMNPPYASQRSFGSVALDWCWLALGRVHLYLHGRSNIWDYAAGEFIFTQAGGFSCSLDGDKVFVKSCEKRSSVGAVSSTLFKEWCDYLNISIR